LVGVAEPKSLDLFTMQLERGGAASSGSRGSRGVTSSSIRTRQRSMNTKP
jgi:hypothetical protein